MATAGSKDALGLDKGALSKTGATLRTKLLVESAGKYNIRVWSDASKIDRDKMIVYTKTLPEFINTPAGSLLRLPKAAVRPEVLTNIDKAITETYVDVLKKHNESSKHARDALKNAGYDFERPNKVARIACKFLLLILIFAFSIYKPLNIFSIEYLDYLRSVKNQLSRDTAAPPAEVLTLPRAVEILVIQLQKGYRHSDRLYNWKPTYEGRKAALLTFLMPESATIDDIVQVVEARDSEWEPRRLLGHTETTSIGTIRSVPLENDTDVQSWLQATVRMLAPIRLLCILHRNPGPDSPPPVGSDWL